ncbi:UDP-glucose 4-epimerase [Microtetraspora sp. NBRC 13810]|uniref:NAD-dependent epimerase/dehydratase family protein n=1 Tax=Microtetraspora sp. NBRC 13810 TaxID=3030990 RepID=UPI0024A193D5|nr:NAD(P)-dependent oxidoreductase [Microtetraspora sp. NBRC 13810]GLW10041.1 UDP-glucose 4-epimerase [Microtetraspora sp. NBRC 13810]
MAKICVTGASGKLGRAVVRDLLDHGHRVVATDVRPGPADLGAPVLLADLTEYGQAVEVLDGVDAVVHLANIPAPGIRTPSETFNANTTMNSNIFLAAAQLRIGRVVWASSETTLGLPFDVPPLYAPVDEAHFPFPTSTYALSKVVGETTAHHVAQWSGIPFAALRFSNILGPDDYKAFPGYWKDALLRRWNLWGYIDTRDAAASCRLALDADLQGAQSFVIAAADTVMNRPSADLMQEVFPKVEIRRPLAEFETLLAIDHAHDVLGFTPHHSWRDHL